MVCVHTSSTVAFGELIVAEDGINVRLRLRLVPNNRTLSLPTLLKAGRGPRGGRSEYSCTRKNREVQGLASGINSW
jgi:hypothetical protein